MAAESGFGGYSSPCISMIEINLHSLCPRMATFYAELNGRTSARNSRKRNDENVRSLANSALAGDCQFNRRCSIWNKCRVAAQVRKPPCYKIMTENIKDDYYNKD